MDLGRKLRRAQVAGVTGFVAFGGAVSGVVYARSLLWLWTFVCFFGLGSMLRGYVLAAQALAARAGDARRTPSDG